MSMRHDSGADCGIWINRLPAPPGLTLNYADVRIPYQHHHPELPAALVNATYVTMGLYSRVDTVAVYLNDQYFTQIVIGTKLTGVLLAPAVSISAGFCRKTMTVDHLLGA